MSAKLKHSSPDGEANGGLSPAKMPRMDEGKETTEERIARMKELLSKGKAPPMVRPKPKPKPKPKLPSITVSDQTMDDGSPLTSPDPEDLEPVLLNPESLAQFSQIADFDFDAVVRQQMLDNTPQKDRAALSQSKGLKDRRLPANLATKVPDDYQDRRRVQSYSTGDLKKKERLVRSYDAPDSGLREQPQEMSEEERKRKILERSGVSQSSPLAALGSILKRRGSGRSKKTSQDSPILKPKPKKDKPAKDSPTATKKISEPLISTPPKSPKSFLRRWGSRGSGRKKGKLASEFESLDGSVDDIRSETSSISSFQTSGREVPMEVEHSKSASPEETPVKPIKENGEMDTGPKPRKETFLEPAVAANTSVSSTHSKRDSACFYKAEVEPLFGDTSTLFDSGELEDMFGKSNKSGSGKPHERTPEKILEEPAAEKREEKAKQQEKAKPEEKVAVPTEKPSTKPAEKSPAETPAERDDVKKVTKSTEKPSAKLAEDSGAETRAERLAEGLASSAKPAEKSPKSPRTDIRARMHMYETKSTSSAEEKPVSTSTPKHETAAAKKTTLLFEDEEGDSFASKKPKENEEQKMDVERKKARLFDDELFQDDLKSEPPKKPAAKKELFSSPARKSQEASESPQRQKKSSLEKEKKETSDLGPSLSFLDEVLMATSSKSSLDEPSEKPSAEKEDKPKEEKTKGDDPKLKEEKTKGDDPKPKEEKTKGDEPKEDKYSKKPYGFGLSGLLEYDESPRIAAKKTSESRQEKESQLDEIADSIFGTKAAEEKQEREKKLDEIADSLFGEDPRHAARARRRAKRRSPEPVERTDMSEPTTDPLGALEEKTIVEKESEERQRELSADRERKAKTTNLFGEEIMEVDAPSEIVGKVSGSEQSEGKLDDSPEIVVQESTPPPTVVASTGDKTETETAPETEDKEGPVKDAEKSEKPKPKSRDVKSKADAKDTRSPSSRVGRNRDSTAEMVRTAAERKSKIPAREEKKDDDGSKPSWMVELQKRKEQKKSEGEDKKTKVTSSSVSKDKETKEAAVPEWQKRAIERRKKAAEAKSSPSSSRLNRDKPEKTSASSASRLDKSPRTGRRVASETATAASPKSGRRSPRETDTTTTASSSLKTGRRSPRETTDSATSASPKSGRRSPRSADTSPSASSRTTRRSARDKEESTESTSAKSPGGFRSRYREYLEREKAEKAEKEKAEKERAAKAKASKGDKPAVSKKPEDVTADSKSSKVTRKPSMEKKSAKIEISTKKVARSTEKEEREEQKVPSFTDEVQPAKKSEETKSEETKSEETKSEETKSEETKSEETKSEETKSEETKPESLSDREETKQSNGESKKDEKPRSEPEEDTEDVFSSATVKSPSSGENKGAEERPKLRSPSPQISKVLTKATSVDSGNSSRRSSVSSETTEQPPYRSRNMSHSRSPTPTPGQPTPGPMKLPPSDSSVPEWKKKLLQKKKSGEGVRKKEPVVAKQGAADVPSWKKELMAKKRSKSPEMLTSSLRETREVRSSTVSTTRPSLQSRGAGRSGRADRKKEEPAFMKEFQLKKQRTSAREN